MLLLNRNIADLENIAKVMATLSWSGKELPQRQVGEDERWSLNNVSFLCILTVGMSPLGCWTEL